VTRMLRHWKLWRAFVANCLTRELQFRINFLITMVTGSMWFIMNVVVFSVIFSHVKAVAGWTKYEVFFLLGTSHVILRLFGTFFMRNLMQVPNLIRTGELDFYLLKPVHPQFLISTRYASFDSLTDTAIGFALMFYALVKLEAQVTLGGALAFAVLVVNGVALYYVMMFIAVTLSFWFVRFHVMEIWWQMTNMARQPAEIFRGTLAMILTYCLPMLVVVNFPVKAYLGRLTWPLGLWGIGVTAALLAFSAWFFQLALTRYRSASS
jgi:ABC-2 type transport system permease protein